MRFLIICLSIFGALAPAQDRPSVVEEFFDAIASNDTNAAARMLESHTNLALATDNISKLPLLEAAAAGNVPLVKRLIELGAKVNAPGDTLGSAGAQDTALHVAIRRNRPAVCEILLKAGADPNRMAFGFTTPLHLAFAENREEMAGLLLDFGADPFREKRYADLHTTPFELAITSATGRLISRMLRESRLTAGTPKPGAELLLDGKAPAMKPAAAQFLATRGSEMLAIAAQRGEFEAVQALLEAGVSAKGMTPEGAPLLQPFALSVAAAEKAKDFKAERWTRIRALLEKNGARCDALAATGLGDLDTARRLVAMDPNAIRATDPQGQTPLHWAVLTDRLPFTSFWLEAGVSPAATNLAGQTALHLAAAQGLPKQVSRLLTAQAPTTERDTNGWTPLDTAIHANQPETIRLLLGKKSGAPHPERGVATSLHQAAAEGNLIALASFVNATNLEARNELGLTPLMLAGKAGQLGASALLLDKGADVNARDPDGNTVLHLIMLSGTHWIAGQPSAAWVERMKQDPRKEKFLRVFVTPSGYTSAREVARSIAFFLACGADAAATNHAGQTILQLAMQEGAMLFEEDRAALLPLLQQSGGGLDQRDANGDTALHRAARNPISGDKAAGLIAAGADVNATNRLARTPLHLSVEHLSSWGAAPIEEILKAKPNVNAQDNEGLTALHVLAASESSFKKEATRALLDAGANPNARDKHGRTPAHLFLAGKWPWSEVGECLAMLVKAGADLSLADDRRQTLLHCLAALGHQSPLFFIRGITNCFNSPKVEVSARDHQGDTPLHVAARTGTSDVFDWLVKRGASLDATNNAGETARVLAARSTNVFARFSFNPETDITRAIQEGKLETLTALVQADPTLVSQPNRFGQTPLRVAVQAHRTNVVEFLEQKGVPWDAATAVLAGRADIVRRMLAREPATITNALYGNTLLHLAAADGNTEITRLLLDAGADMRARNPWGLSPLVTALQYHRPEVAALLRAHGASENVFDAVYTGQLTTLGTLLSKDKSLARACNAIGLPVASIAAGLGHADVLKLLLSKGASASAVNEREGRTPLHFAALGNRADTAELLIRKGAKVEAVDCYGFTPLHLAACQGSTEVAALLLKHKADPNARTASPVAAPMFPMGSRVAVAGNSPLHLAALFGQTNVIGVLLKFGALVNATNSTGRTALDLTSQPGFSSAMTSLLRGLLTRLEPPGVGQSARPSPFGPSFERQKAAASQLKNAGGERATNPQRGPGPF